MHSPFHDKNRNFITFISLKWVERDFLFHFILIFNLLLLSFTRFYPSMDGPAHLYNSNLLVDLIKGNPAITDYYSINTLPVPNWTSHVLLLLFNSLLPAWLAEKVLLYIYVIGMAFSFRYMIIQINPEARPYIVMIFPFMYSFLFHLGFYNFSLSFILLFLIVGFWFKHADSIHVKEFIFLLIMLTASYFTNIMVFALTGFILGLKILTQGFNRNSKDFKLQQIWKDIFNKLFLLFVLCLPGLILMTVFINKTSFSGSDKQYTLSELVQWIFDARPFIVYSYSGEKTFTGQYFYALIIFAFIGFLLRKNSNSKQRFLNYHAIIFFVPLLLIFVCYLIIPDGAEAGMMSDRFCLILYMLALVWITIRIKPSLATNLVMLIVIVIHIGLQFKHFNGSIRNLNRDACLINQAAGSIKQGSVVLPINMSDNWLEIHFSNYLGVEKPMIILENYEAGVGWFPVIWDKSNVPMATFNSLGSFDDPVEKNIDYIVFYGNKQKINERCNTNKALKQYFKAVFENSNVLVFERFTKN